MGLHIGIVTEYYYPLLGGISENVHHTAVELQRLGHRVTVITSRNTEGPPHELPVPNGVPVVRLGTRFSFHGNGAGASATRGGIGLWSELAHELRTGGYDLLQLHSPLNFTLPPLGALLGRCPRVGTFHSVFDPNLVYQWLGPILQSQFLRRLRGVTAVAPSVVRALEPYFRLNAHIVPNGVDTTAFNPATPRLERFGPDKRTLLFLGRFDPRNGLPLMLETFTRVHRQVDDVRLVVVGSGTATPAELLRNVPSDVAADVHFEGPALLERPGFYATADIFCSPVSKASFGITLLEAMATGTPIVATDNAGYRDLVGPDEAELVPADPGRFASTIVSLLGDDTRRHQMREAGLRKAASYAWPVVTAQLLSYFMDILAAS